MGGDGGRRTRPWLPGGRDPFASQIQEETSIPQGAVASAHMTCRILTRLYTSRSGAAVSHPPEAAGREHHAHHVPFPERRQRVRPHLGIHWFVWQHPRGAQRRACAGEIMLPAPQRRSPRRPREYENRPATLRPRGYPRSAPRTRAPRGGPMGQCRSCRDRRRPTPLLTLNRAVPDASETSDGTRP